MNIPCLAAIASIIFRPPGELREGKGVHRGDTEVVSVLVNNERGIIYPGRINEHFGPLHLAPSNSGTIHQSLGPVLNTHASGWIWNAKDIPGGPRCNADRQTAQFDPV